MWRTALTTQSLLYADPATDGRAMACESRGQACGGAAFLLGEAFPTHLRVAAALLSVNSREMVRVNMDARRCDVPQYCVPGTDDADCNR